MTDLLSILTFMTPPDTEPAFVSEGIYKSLPPPTDFDSIQSSVLAKCVYNKTTFILHHLHEAFGVH